jgi:HD-like signal output (HDOD) protein
MDVGRVRDYQAAVFTYQCFHEVGPSVFLDFFFRQNSDLHNYYTRNANNLVTDYRSGSHTGFQMKHLVQGVWNFLPDSVKAAEHQYLFNKKVKNFLLGGWGARIQRFKIYVIICFLLLLSKTSRNNSYRSKELSLNLLGSVVRSPLGKPKEKKNK